MTSKHARLDRYLSKELGINRRDVRAVLAQGRVLVDGIVAEEIQQVINQFSHVSVDGRVLQDKSPSYVMMNKPVGVVSATKDDRYKTVIDLMTRSDRSSLHITGRLDFNSTGLLLLTNDGRWSRALSAPENKITKVYRVTVMKPITDDYISAFAEGMYFPYEGLTTKPAMLEIISETVAKVTLVEGRYHQIKRMFGRFRNPVLALHRVAIGNLMLDPALHPEQSRELTDRELDQLF